MAIPFLDLQAQFRSIEPEIREAIDGVLQSCAFAGGPTVAAFEEQFADYCGAAHGVGVSSGTAALHLALRALEVGPGDEVITTPHTFVSTAWAISYVGATPVFVDIDPAIYTIDPALIEPAITARTRAIIPVHLYGQPADMDPVLEIAERHGLYVVEDAAQAHGARYRGRPCGSMGDLACFSFYPGKNLGAYGEGGAVVTGDADLADRIRALRNHGQSTRYVHTEIGYNYRMDGIQGAVLGVKLRHLDAWNEARRRVASAYDASLAPVSFIRCPQEAPYARHVYHLYAIRLRAQDARDALRAYLDANEIGTGLHYPQPVHLQPAYAHLGYRRGDFPEAERTAACILSLPIFPEMTREMVEQVAAAIDGFAATSARAA